MRKYQRYLLVFFIQLSAISFCNAKIDTLLVQSPSMNKSIPNLVVTPKNYDQYKGKYASLYLLHGAGGDFKQWLSIEPELQMYADQYNILIICPDGDKTSWYFDSPVDATMKYETYISKELVKIIDNKYHTIPDRKSRAISGLSMGGHGAFYIAIRNLDVWGAAGSTSGGLDFRAFPDNWDLPKRLGNYADHKENWEKNTVINMIESLKGKDIQLIFDCGVEDFFLDANRRTHLKFLELKIPHVYIEMPGNHNGEYWKNSLRYHLLFFKDFFSRN